MDTSPLKAFAIAVRVQLLREVSARLSIVLASSSIARVEASRAVSALERAIEVCGGGDSGQKAIIDQVAYMWFNRIIALRFMDANGYTGVGVVSPEKNLPSAQPEILTQAKMGLIDSDVLDAKLSTRVSGLLNGTIRSEDSQNEAYGILLMAYCHHWNKSMPFMFERDGDFTELLIPANLLSDESVIAKVLKTLTAEFCNDVEVIGWLYQFYISERKDEVFTGFKNNMKAGPAEIPAATQLFTPDWIVRYLLENSLGRLWLLNRPDSKLASRMEFYIPPIDVDSDFLKISNPQEFKVMDPACGSGHMLTYAFDLLYAIYEEEGYSPTEIPILILKNNLFGIEIDPRAGSLAAFALAMKARSKHRTFFTKGVAPNICVLQPISFTPDELTELVTLHGHRLEEEDFLSQFEDADLFGSLIIPNGYVTTELEDHLRTVDVDTLHGQDLYDRARRVMQQAEYLSPRYNIVVANPPYMGSKNMNSKLNEYASQTFPNSKSDLFAMFIERSLDLVSPRGYVAMITMQSWMFLSSYQSLRAALLTENFLAEMAHLGTNAFDSIGGDVVSTTAFIIEKVQRPQAHGTFIRLVDGSSEAAKIESLRVSLTNNSNQTCFAVKSTELKQIPGAPIAYWLSASMVKVFSQGRPLGEVASPRVGLQTGANARFVRSWWEIDQRKFGFDTESVEDAQSSGRKWFPYNKGGEFRRWYGNQEFVVNWESNGREVRSFGAESGRPRSRAQNTNYYFKPSISWSLIGAGVPSFRYFPKGFIFDVAGMSVFSEDDAQKWMLLGLLNSKVSEAALAAIAPTLNFQVGDIARIPVPTVISDDAVGIVSKLVEIAQVDWDSNELSWHFSHSALTRYVEGVARAEIDTLRQYQHTLNIDRIALVEVVRKLEESNNQFFIDSFLLGSELEPDVESAQISLFANKDYRYPVAENIEEREASLANDDMKEFISYSVGCMFGRYSLDKPGLILANQNETLNDYLGQVPNPSFMPDIDNVIPVIDGEWFEDDIVIRFRQFLRITFGDVHFEENLRFIEESLGKEIRKYFVADFYKDHVQRYKKRPIYWLFSSRQGSFNALIYMHRYSPSTASLVLNEYLREFDAKLRAELINQERISLTSTNPRDKVRADKETDRIRKVLLELSEYEHDVLYPLATRQLTIDLDDGVKVNYSKFGSALKSIPGLGASDE